MVTRDVGGSFGVRGGAYAESIALALAAQKLGRPVKWVAARSELFLSENHGRALSLTGELALDADGRFLALRFDDRADLGAYATMFGALVGSRNLTITMGGVYRIPALYGRARLAYSNATPVSSYRGAGRPDIACAIERLVDHAAAEHGFDPAELRRKNFIPPEAMPYKTANGTTYDCGEFAAVMGQGAGASPTGRDSPRGANSRRAGTAARHRHGELLEASGAGGAPRDQVRARFDANGDLHLYAVSQSGGQGHETTFVNIVSAELGIAGERLHFHEGDPDLTLVGNGTGGSRSLYAAGSAFKLLGPKIIATAGPQRRRGAGCRSGDAAIRGRRFHAADRRIGLFELAQQLAATAGGASTPPHGLRRRLPGRRDLPQRLPYCGGRDRPGYRRKSRSSPTLRWTISAPR